MNKSIIVVLVLVVILGAVYYFGFGKKTSETPATETPASEDQQTTTETPMIFTNPQSGDSVAITFVSSDDTAKLTGLGYSDLELYGAVSASGARYTNDEEKVEVWNRGEAVTISINSEEVFQGNIGGVSDVEKLTANTWVWQATNADEVVVEPKDETAFTLTFNTVSSTVNATTDCNNIFGPYTVGEDNTLTFGTLAMTKKYCEGSQETVFAEGLAKVAKFDFNGAGALMLSFASSTDFMLFSR